VEEAPSTGDAPRAGQRRRRDGAGGHARGGSSSPREDEGEVEPATGTWPGPLVRETRGGEASPGKDGGAAAGRENWKCRSAAGRALAAGWRAAWSTCLPRGRVARYWSTSICPPFRLFCGPDGCGPVVCWSCFAGGGWPLHLCSAMLRPHAPKPRHAGPPSSIRIRRAAARLAT